MFCNTSDYNCSKHHRACLPEPGDAGDAGAVVVALPHAGAAVVALLRAGAAVGALLRAGAAVVVLSRAGVAVVALLSAGAAGAAGADSRAGAGEGNFDGTRLQRRGGERGGPPTTLARFTAIHR